MMKESGIDARWNYDHRADRIPGVPGTRGEYPADFIHLASTSLPPYLKDLTDLPGIIEYRVPVTEFEAV